MVNLTIDGQQISIEEGKTLLEAAEELGIRIPTLCYHKALSPYGACRVCVVEIIQRGASKIVASCLYPVQDGLEVQTDTEQVLKTRRLMVELLLARCPEAPDIKELAASLEVAGTRIEPKNKDCSLCGLCVRMCHERMGVGAISFSGRGPRREVVPPFEQSSSICQVCGACQSVCPAGGIKLEKITSRQIRPILKEFNRGLNSRPAIHIPFPQAVPNVASIDRRYCVHLNKDKCETCKEFCAAGAINYDQKEETLKIKTGGVILSPGFSEFDPSDLYNYGYHYANVVTSIQFERILSASGPFEGHIKRLSDHADPKSIAFIQCIGSRDRKHKYCSSVCCMYATKEAIIAKDHCDYELAADIFYMDIRAFGKGFEAYYERAKNEFGVHYIRSRPFSVVEIPETKNLILRYTGEDGKVCEKEYDMVVLSIGLNPPKDYKKLSEELEIELNDFGYCQVEDGFKTSREGIFVSGAFSGPKDIPESVAQASGAAAEVSGIISGARGSLTVTRTYPEEKNIAGENPRIGVFVCHCGINIGGIVDVPSVVEYVRSLPDVVYAEDNLYTCSQDTQANIIEKVRELNLNRVIVASCTPRTHQPLFQETCREAGLNKYLFEMANIRDQCSWVHSGQPKKATEKAKILVKMAVVKSRTLQPLEEATTGVKTPGLIIGAGVAGMNAALRLASCGCEAFLIERESELGGKAKEIFSTLEEMQVGHYLNSLIQKVENNPKIKIYKKAKIEEINGYVGNYKTRISQEHGARSTEMEHGIVIIANGGQEYKPTEYLYGQDERVITQLELEERLAHSSKLIAHSSSVVMINCVGSRDEERLYCSRVCCSHAIKNALKIKELNPKANIYILYRDIRTYGFKENYYKKAREAGILFIRYDQEKKPVVEADGETLKVTTFDPIIQKKLIINPDMVVLGAAIIPNSENEELGKMLKVPLTKEGFFLEAHIKLRPLDFATEGVFFAGLAHAPKGIVESAEQGAGAVSRALTILSKSEIQAEGAVSMVKDDSLCRGCEKCAEGCEFNAIEMVDYIGGTRVSKINPIVCKGCGACAAQCQTGAITPLHFATSQINGMVEAALA